MARNMPRLRPAIQSDSRRGDSLMRERGPWRDSRGLTATELLVTVGIIGILAALGLPSLLSYYQASALTSGAQELQSLLNRGRQLAISQNQNVCVEQATSKIRFRTSTGVNCGGTVWVGSGTDANGYFALTNGVEISSATANVIFNYLGAAPQTGSYTVRNPADGRTTTVTVTASGRITIP